MNHVTIINAQFITPKNQGFNCACAFFKISTILPITLISLV